MTARRRRSPRGAVRSRGRPEFFFHNRRRTCHGPKRLMCKRALDPPPERSEAPSRLDRGPDTGSPAATDRFSRTGSKEQAHGE